MRPLIALTTDFGLEDPYVGVMKGVILGICPEARIVDVTHGVAPHDLVAGFLALEAARPYFPPGTVHVAVVDPGVGTKREALAVLTDREVYLAPDNGLLSFLPEEEIREVRSIRNTALMLHPVSRTFQGRDLFAPVAAQLAAGFPLADVGPVLAGIVRLSLPGVQVSGTEVRGEILAFDRFGNAVTTIRAQHLRSGESEVLVGDRAVPLVRTYGDVGPGSALALLGSFGRLELGVREGSARETLGLRRGTVVSVRRR